jgi:hypothetical protein
MGCWVAWRSAQWCWELRGSQAWALHTVLPSLCVLTALSGRNGGFWETTIESRDSVRVCLLWRTAK